MGLVQFGADKGMLSKISESGLELALEPKFQVNNKIRRTSKTATTKTTVKNEPVANVRRRDIHKD